MSNVTVHGSWGELTVHAATGVITDARHDEIVPADAAEGEVGYRAIARFDPVPFARWAEVSSFDILATGYWTHEGGYADPLTMRTCEDRRGGQSYMEFDDWVPFALLPPPTR